MRTVDPIEPMEDELRALLLKGAPSAVAPAGAKSATLLALRAAIATSVAEAASPEAVQTPALTAQPAASAIASAGLTKLATVALLSFALGGATGAAVAVRAMRSEASYAPSAAAPTRGLPAPEPSAPPPPREVPVVQASDLPDSAPIRSSVSGTPSGGSGGPAPPKVRHDGSSERLLLDEARQALARGDAVASLRAIAEHERVAPEGALAEEREALAVQALAARGLPEARARAARFAAKYPQSLLHDSVEAAVRTMTRGPDPRP